jgi:hypothetical protein
MDHFMLFFKYNKLYFFTGAFLLLLLFLPTKEKISGKTQKALYVAAVIWVLCFAYRITTGQDIIYLLDNKDNYSEYNYNEESQPAKVGGPFNKYFSNEAGRKSQ